MAVWRKYLCTRGYRGLWASSEAQPRVPVEASGQTNQQTNKRWLGTELGRRLAPRGSSTLRSEMRSASAGTAARLGRTPLRFPHPPPDFRSFTSFFLSLLCFPLVMRVSLSLAVSLTLPPLQIRKREKKKSGINRNLHTEVNTASFFFFLFRSFSALSD